MTSLDVAAHLPRLRRHARFLCGDAADADDLVQATLSKAVARAGLFRPGGDLRVWLLALLHDTFVARAGSQGRQKGELGIGHLPAATAEASVEPQRMLEALDQLPDEQRRVILLVSVDGMTTSEAAVILGQPVGTVRSRLAQGREALRRLTRCPAARRPLLRLVGGPDVRSD